jgi:hypothetical protein
VHARSSVRDAELHGMLDTAGHVDGAASIWDLLATKDKALDEVLLVTPGPLATSGPVETSYAVLDAPGSDIPYLPDPLCVELSARLLHHPTIPDTTLVFIPAYVSGAQWPNATPFTIRAFEDAGPTFKFDAAARVLQISLPKATRATLQLSCRLIDPQLMGIWQWLPAADRGAVGAAAKNGRHWALTPWRTVELVHAVQKPLIAPEMKFSLSRGFGQTAAVPRFASTCSLASTVRVDLQAAWHEPDNDAATQPIGGDRARIDHAFSVKITDPQTYATKKDIPGALGIPEHLIIGPDLISVGENRDLTIVKAHEFNDTRYRRIEYWLEATSRFREYMPASLLTTTANGATVETDEHIKVTGPTVVTWIPSSAPPPAPNALYVVPTFGWVESSDAQGKQTRLRRGGGLRVYLDRGWNASGYGEMLAVVLPRAGFAGDPNVEPAGRTYKKFVTQWGQDPIWDSPAVSGPSPKLAHFPLARTQPDPTGAWLPPFAPPTEADQPHGPFATANLPHPSMAWNEPASYVDVAPHDVAYDPERQLWYCDITINFGASYYPFVRLALARYQPASVFGAALSNIVLADFMALAPDRWLTVAHGSDRASHNVTVFGHTYSDSSGHREASHAPSSIGVPNRPENPVAVSPRSVVEVWVETLDPDRGEDFGWQREPDATVSRTTDTPMGPAGPAGPVGPMLPIEPLRPGAPVGPLAAATQSVVRPRQRPGVTTVVEPSLLLPQLISPVLWQGTVRLPARRPDGQRYRLVVAEYEEYLVDDATPYNLTPSAKGRRLVYVDHVAIG